MISVNLVQPYMIAVDILRLVQQDHPDWSLEHAQAQICRQISEEFILGAARQLFPKMTWSSAAGFAPVMQQVGSGQPVLELSQEQFDGLYWQFWSKRAQDEVGFDPGMAYNYTLWMEYLQSLKKEAS